MDRASLSTLHARATDLLAALLSHADCEAVVGERAVVAACIPFDLLDDAFAVLGALEDLEEQHDTTERPTTPARDRTRCGAPS